MQQRVFYLDLLRCVAAIAVVAIHVLGPYRHMLGDAPLSHWLSAASINSAIRWAVPIFIMITGALLLSDRRPFDLRYYVQRRVVKVVLPFLVWSFFFAWVASLSPTGSIDWQLFQEKITGFFSHETYYHLGFFYYFIPLYFVAPFLAHLAKHADHSPLIALLVVWLSTTALNLFYIDGLWSNDLWLFSGYLLLGYLLFAQERVSGSSVMLMCAIAIAAILCNAYQVVTLSLEAEQYRVGRWLSYKTINTVVEAAALFLLIRYLAPSLSRKTKEVVSFVSRHSLGIYLVHPLILLPLYQWRWYEGNHALWTIPVWTVIGFSGALALSWGLSRTRYTRWLVP
ncbi:putative acyltransferase [Vibrio nigripulchritudo SO65]|uniref:acyltransferase n=1 Tax=Vibrio nigripulchritudo TaxID=28173 RepID=UPI0003B2392D|nr:acyltransferase family protein [Vibrio nigripulchritudo]CCN35301.1 putative acyltransferase [Vibrio nigripulchritudo AM115]CCN42722.1 putative acyltransferase [Vibrio nigripulchritudo FTn2]CCN64126.1 putative acyltransferase [Vibrio nigripulchritudo POn4]CCN78928.1 putative acyltransferase [Vibrio nigripulchritudo SO65]